MTLACHPPFTLTPLLPLETPRAVPAVPRAALMPFIVDDEFHVFARERRLPPCALSFLMLAGSWSARESRSGFVPNAMLADFGDDFAQTERTLCSAGILKRVKGGVRIIEGRGLTVINAKDVRQDIEAAAAAVAEQRQKWKATKQRQRDEKKAEQRERIAAGVSGVSAGTNADVHPENPGNPKKPQVNGIPVQVDIPKTSTETPGTTASDYQDQIGSVRVDQSNARAREAPSAETLALVVAGISKKLKRPVSEAEALRAITEWERRAEAKGDVVHEPLKFFPACIRRERRLEEILAPPLTGAAQQWAQLGKAAEPAAGPGFHVFAPAADPFDDACAYPGCGVKKSNARHVKQEAGTG